MTIAIKPIIGGNGDDILNGGNGHELLSGRGGNDLINSGNGHDVAYGGAGNDEIHGNSGNDTLYGSGGPSFVDLSGFTIANDYEGSVIFQSESAGYKNSLGSYTKSPLKDLFLRCSSTSLMPACRAPEAAPSQVQRVT